ncbi:MULTISPECIES: pyridoxal kinase PdxY [Alphaproteobacteria]|uniref:pyridoxal kinase PdxY n=1 Tax=Alphaproteobacteria TaxID=28211 RepID=UPI0019D32696|nr:MULTISPECIES: pyridoxal kinase PdxY [Alphaproteobacteria]MBY6021980.1 pyridoxal kinase PdxY [Nitratireductor sp. DP7N14-4]MBN7757193.1 pyridoxal kinase PdxY [Nitratireductor aquimarinus]MBN7761135.1 pyridoxal kinase PdxY [Nitratireductor aquibiodomus]MBN7777269.1 pyridoxal kinase PdxY [Nitratireductor pacificus]MBN7780940.1 pyridoxal kinase PdxY [Nitratireductor pacificus]
MTNQDNRGEARAVIVISSHVARGSVGNRAAVFTLEALGFPVWAVPTVILPWHPGHGPATRIVPEADQFARFIHDLENAPWLGEVSAVLTGYLGGPEQATAIAGLVKTLKAHNPQARYVCDPVLGDKGGLYVPEATATAIRDQLLPLADITTPNRYELAWLTGMEISGTESAIRAARQAPPADVMVTSAPASSPDRLANLLVSETDVLRAVHDSIPSAPNGTGDLTAALYLARLLAGETREEALAKTTGSVVAILNKAAERGSNELMLETDRQILTRPEMSIEIEHVAETAEA